jgi:asparagine synthase (glutamine-hydrolysing)
MFEQHFPGEAAAACVPFEASVACSTAAALLWDESLNSTIDPSGRAVADVHEGAAPCTVSSGLSGSN